MARDRQNRRRPVSLALGVGGALLAALLWSRLKLVTGIPRTAYADPQGRQVTPDAGEPVGSGRRVTSENRERSQLE